MFHILRQSMSSLNVDNGGLPGECWVPPVITRMLLNDYQWING